jgi:molybdenum ABC transporter molybdate-binding protein
MRISKNKIKNYLSIKAAILIAGFFTLTSCQNKEDSDKSLLFYCAAGIKPVVEKVAQNYYKEYGVRVDLQYGGSGTLLSNLRVAKQGDLYLAGDKSYIDEGITFGFIKETQPLASMSPVIAVAKGNPKGIRSIEDLINENIKVAIANPDAASIGRLTKKILTDSGQWKSLKENVTVLMPTVNEVANSIKIGAVDAGIIWDATAKQYEELDFISVTNLNQAVKNITIGVLKYSENPTEALKFLRYLSARDKGLPVFKKLGYRPIKGDIWSEDPQLLFFSGGVNRLAIEQTIRSFEKREGVEIARVYNGCGILVSQMKAGQKPDAYLSCDLSFMTQVEDRFTDITDISRTDIIIATKKGNPLNIQSLQDLTKDGLQIGICNHNQSALGSLTKRLLEEKELWDPVYKNVRSQTPTADLLVNQIRTGSLDAVIVYEANVSKIRDKLDIVELNDEQALALQNFGISKDSNHQYLMKRLLNALTDGKSKKEYLEHGFSWEFNDSINNK